MLQEIKKLAAKLELEEKAIESYLKSELKELLGLAEDNLSAAREYVESVVDAENSAENK